MIFIVFEVYVYTAATPAKIDLTIFGPSCKSFLSWDIKSENTLLEKTIMQIQIHRVILERNDLSDLILNNKNGCLQETMLLYCLRQ